MCSPLRRDSQSLPHQIPRRCNHFSCQRQASYLLSPPTPPTTASLPSGLPAHDPLPCSAHCASSSPPYPFPYSSQYVDSNPFGHIYRYLGDPPRLQASALSEWCCESVLEAWTKPRSAQWLSVYLDGSWDRPWAGSAAILCWPDSITIAPAIPCPHHSSKDSEFWAFVQCTRYLESVGFKGSVFYCIDNSQLVSCIDNRLAGEPHIPASSSTRGTWQCVVDDLIHAVRFDVGVGWLKPHVGFTGNEIADAFAKYTA